MVAEEAPRRTNPRSARSPIRNLSAPKIIDLPAPVSPVTATNPDGKSQESSSTRAKLRILSERSIQVRKENKQKRINHKRTQKDIKNSLSFKLKKTSDRKI